MAKILQIFTFFFFCFSLPVFGTELKQGRYIGWVDLEEKKERLAVVADFYLESPEDFTQFPRLNASFRISLGGYNTHEYFTETFHDLKYDFDFGALTFDEEGNDLLMTTEVTSAGGRSKVSGDVFIRSSALRGRLELLEESDEPGDDFLPLKGASNVAFSPLLEGQYEGVCSGKEAALQVQTVRGLSTIEGSGLERHYGISGRLIFKKDPFCKGVGKEKWCARRHFQNGSFNFYTGRLLFQSKQGAEECNLEESTLSCRFRDFKETIECRLQKTPGSKPLKFFSRRFYLDPSEDQNKALPNPNPPKNQELASSLKGRFVGYLHNETNDTYIPLRLDVIPFSSTENPHNPNQTMVSAVASLFLGRDFSGPFLTQQFEPRSFYLRPGFMLTGNSTDSILSVTNWKSGLITGTWLSKSFGKIGTFQLLKGEVPPLPPSLKSLASFAGEYKGKSGSLEQWIRFLFPAQPDKQVGQVIPFTGSYQLVAGDTPVRAIEEGAIDLLTGRFGWRITNDEVNAFGSGYMDDSEGAYLFLPPLPVVGAVTPSFEFRRFIRVKENNP